jgi:hypothetical protein
MIEDLHLGMVAMHMLHHGLEQQVTPGWMADELDKHGYSYDREEVERGLRNLVARGLMETDEEEYWTSDQGKERLDNLKAKARQLSSEVLER